MLSHELDKMEINRAHKKTRYIFQNILVTETSSISYIEIEAAPDQNYSQTITKEQFKDIWELNRNMTIFSVTTK